MSRLNKKNRKAQVWALDLSIGLMVFVAIILLFYRYSVSFAPEDTSIDKMIEQGSFFTESLLTEGYPPNWSLGDITSVYTIGLLNDNVLNVTKWEKFCDWGDPNGTEYGKVKEKLATDFAFYVFLDKNSDGNADQISEGGCSSAGKSPVSANPSQLLRIERLTAYYDENSMQIEPIKLILFLWSHQET